MAEAVACSQKKMPKSPEHTDAVAILARWLQQIFPGHWILGSGDAILVGQQSLSVNNLWS